MIRGLRTVCRPMEPDDQMFVHQLNADPVVRANVIGWQFPTSLHQQISWFTAHDEVNTRRWIIEDLDGQRIGLTGLWDIDWQNRHAMTGLKIGGPAARRGQGFGTDAILAVMCFAFYDVGLARLHSTILADNTASIVAYTKHCGWEVEGRGRQHIWRNGRFNDVIHIGALRSEFDTNPKAIVYRDALLRSGVDRRPADA